VGDGVLLTAGSTGFAQEQPVALQKYAPPSPNAAELGKYAIRVKTIL
jgi:hypothetical protein